MLGYEGVRCGNDGDVCASIIHYARCVAVIHDSVRLRCRCKDLWQGYVRVCSFCVAYSSVQNDAGTREGTGQDKQEGTEKTIQCSGCVRCGTMLWDDGDGKSLGRVELLGDAEVGWPR
jgi:hypothetical protein